MNTGEDSDRGWAGAKMEREHRKNKGAKMEREHAIIKRGVQN